jgi:hypothetical protein
MWPKLIAKAKEGGLDVIQTYVFWNVHEPVQGQVEMLFPVSCKCRSNHFENMLYVNGEKNERCVHCTILTVQLRGKI